MMRECMLTIQLWNPNGDYSIKLKGELDSQSGVVNYEYSRVRSWIEAMGEIENNERLANMTKNLIFVAAA